MYCLLTVALEVVHVPDLVARNVVGEHFKGLFQRPVRREQFVLGDVEGGQVLPLLSLLRDLPEDLLGIVAAGNL